jgi:2-methylcitrate dehydratase PrpD
MRRAFGIAATQAAGLRKSLGTMCKPINAAKAAMNGLSSVILAEQGFTGADDFFDGDYSIFFMFDFKVEAEQLLDSLGHRFEITHNGIKGYACAGWRNPIVDTMIQLSRKHNLKPDDISGILIEASHQRLNLPNYPEPETGLQGKFSCEHAAAVALADRAGGVTQFTDEKVNEPTLVALRRKVKILANECLGNYQINTVIRTTDGRELTHFVPVPKGDPGNPFTQEELNDKFRANASAVLPSSQIEELVKMINSIEEVPDLAQLLEMCRPR